jgi:S-adenosylhomocysteine hydrolase
MVEHDVKNLSLANDGRLKIEWAEQSMPVLRQVRERFTTSSRSRAFGSVRACT